MAEPRTWMPFYIGDYLADTMHLTTEQHGAYLLLIIAYWRNRGPLPADDTKLRSIVRLDAKAWAQSRDTLAGFFQQEGDVWRHKRIDAELTRAQQITDKRSAAGKASAQQKANKRPAHVEHVNEQIGVQTTLPSPSPVPTEPPPNPRKRGGLPAEQSSEFEGWYAEYPHKVGRGAAERAWNGARAQASLAELSEGLARYVATKRPDVPWCNPATWLNAKRWLDAPADTTPAAEQSEVSQADRDARRVKWAGRLAEFRETGKWQSAWGAEPWSGNNGCLVPLDMREDFNNAQIATDPWLAQSRAMPREAAQ